MPGEPGGLGKWAPRALLRGAQGCWAQVGLTSFGDGFLTPLDSRCLPEQQEAPLWCGWEGWSHQVRSQFRSLTPLLGAPISDCSTRVRGEKSGRRWKPHPAVPANFPRSPGCAGRRCGDAGPTAPDHRPPHLPVDRVDRRAGRSPRVGAGRAGRAGRAALSWARAARGAAAVRQRVGTAPRRQSLSQAPAWWFPPVSVPSAWFSMR